MTNNPVKVNVKSGKVEKLVRVVDKDSRGSNILKKISNNRFNSSFLGSSKHNDSLDLN